MKKNNNNAVRISRYMSEFLYDYAPNFLTYSPHTIRSYREALTLYVKYLENLGVTPNILDVQHFNKEHIEGWLKWLSEERNCCPDTCNVRLGSLRVFLQFLGEKDIAYLFLYQEAKLVKRKKCIKKKVEGLTRKAVTAILNEADLSSKTGRRDYTLLMMLYGTAARIGEILAVKIKHLNLDSKKPFVHLHGKGGKRRTAYLLPRAANNIRGYIREFHGANPNPDDFLFYSRVGGSKGMLTEPAIDKRIKKYSAAAHTKCCEVPLGTHAHQFRHAKASHWLEDGMNIVQISFLLGHECLNTTMKYLDVTIEEKIKALATLETEKERNMPKKWKTNDISLTSFLGLS
ncbi:tyrosine-type recombinase/integrase [Thomasclavelia ramosa]|uniref:tyrosine-type recombinase/integrase n=1 Tax=Thomasclavelia ramosa TaxID=1547 RepID=UPI0034A33CA7